MATKLALNAAALQKVTERHQATTPNELKVALVHTFALSKVRYSVGR